MSASDTLNKIAKVRRSQAFKERLSFLYDVDTVTASKVAYCGSWIHFREWIDLGESKVINANLCKKKFLCETCAIRRQAKAFAHFLPRVQNLREERPDLIPVHITFGVVTGSSLQERFDHFFSARRRMLEATRRAASKTSNNTRHLEFSKLEASIRSFEVKRAKGNSDHWNVHQHILAFVNDYIDVEKLSAEWQHFTGDSFIVDVRKIHSKDGEKGDLESALSEVIKYPLKFEGLSPADAWEASQTFKGRRMTDALGLLRGAPPEDLETDDGIDEMSGPYRDFIAQWAWEREAFQIRPAEAKLRIERPNRKQSSNERTASAAQ